MPDQERAMATETPGPEAATVAGSIVSELLGDSGVKVQPLVGGNVAKTFRVVAGGRSVVVRMVRGMPDAFAADAVIDRLVAGTSVPVPALLEVGERDGWLFAVSEFMPGQNADRLDPGPTGAIIPELIRTMSAIHRVDVSPTTGFGSIGSDGNGRHASWRDYLLTLFDTDAAGYWYDWRNRLAGSLLDWELFEVTRSRMLALLDYCPERRWLVHGDYGFGNVLVEDGRISAVVDWSNAKFGDFMWDVAWLRFWPSDSDLTETLRRDARPDGGVIPSFDERLACYQLVIGLDALRFSAKADDESAYAWVTERVTGVLAGCASLAS